MGDMPHCLVSIGTGGGFLKGREPWSYARRRVRTGSSISRPGGFGEPCEGTRLFRTNEQLPDAINASLSPEVGVNARSMAGWIGFAGLLMLIIGGIDFVQGLIALLEDEYFVPTSAGFLVVDLTAWGWALLIWGVLLFFAGLALISGKSWARWFTIVLVAANVFAQLGFLGNSQYPLWALTTLTLNVIVLYALTARWDESDMSSPVRP
jgi:hypothetical protein